MSDNKPVYANGIDPSLLTKAPGEKWTDKYPHLGTEQVSYEDATSSEFYQLEKEAVFRRNWLYAGRAEWVDRPGKYFTKEYEVCNTSVIVVRGKDDQIRAFYNVCPHRGNKLLWKDEPTEPVEGSCNRFYCKYHGLGFGLDGKIEVLTDKESWFGDQGTDLGLAEIPIESWNGFLFVNMSPEGPAETLREFLGEYYWSGFDGWPFDKFTERFTARGSTNCNWKGLMDAFNEVYHGVYVHREAFPYLQKMDVDALAAMRVESAVLVGKHGFYISPRNPQGLFVTDIERIAQCAGTGPQYPMAEDFSKIPPAANPTDIEWGTSSHFIFPNIQIQFYYPGWYLIYQYWPLAHNKMRFEIDCHYLPSRNFSELMSHYGHVATFWDAALQDINNLEATQLGLEMGAFKSWPLTDEEVIVRGFHKQIYDHVNSYKSEKLGVAAQ